MALKYTGRAVRLTIEDKVYTTAEEYKKNPKAYAGSFDKPIPIDVETATKLVNASKMHSFETEKGEDLEEKLTAPSA